jgi:hypothetical protein
MNFVRDLTLRYGHPLGYLDRSRVQWRHVSALPTYSNSLYSGNKWLGFFLVWYLLRLCTGFSKRG